MLGSERGRGGCTVAETYAAEIEAEMRRDADAGAPFHGGEFCALELTADPGAID